MYVTDNIRGSQIMLGDVQEFRILDFNPLYLDIHCEIHVQLKFELEKIRNSDERCIHIKSCNFPWKWSAKKEVEYETEIDEGDVNELVDRGNRFYVY